MGRVLPFNTTIHGLDSDFGEMQPSKRQKVTMEGISSEVESSETGNETPINWRDDADKYQRRNKYAMENRILTDVNFTVGPQKKLFSAHKIFLALASPVFEAMFYGSLKESNDTIDIPDITPCGFKALLDFVYSDDISFSSEVDAFSTWLAAEKYCMPSMKDACFKYLTTCEINSSNVWVVLHNALFFNSLVIVDRCGEYLKANTSDAIKSPSFVEASKEVIEYFVKLDVLNIREIELLNSIVKWGKEREGTSESLQQILQPFMKYIRFGCMSEQELVSFVDEHKNVISDKNVIEILKYMISGDIYSLPDWCSTCVFLRKSNNDKFNSKQIRSYSLSAKHSQNNSLLNEEHNRHSISHPDQRLVIRTYHSDSDDSTEGFYVVPFQPMRSLNGRPIRSPSSVSDSSITDSSSASSSSFDM